jgi:hypothetical protein
MQELPISLTCLYLVAFMLIIDLQNVMSNASLGITYPSA